MNKNIQVAGIDVIIIATVVVFFFLADAGAVKSRSLPPPGPEATIVRVVTEQDVYRAYRSAGLWGAHVLHLNRRFNLLDYFPEREKTSRPFPIETYDIRPSYEQGLNSDTWLFIATRTGFVREVTSVLPDAVFRERLNDARKDYAFRTDGSEIRGYQYEVPRTITTIGGLKPCREPVVMNVDAGYFAEGADPAGTAAALRRLCPDVRIVVLVDSTDQPEVTPGMRMRLTEFGRAWEAAR